MRNASEEQLMLDVLKINVRKPDEDGLDTLRGGIVILLVKGC